MFFKKSRRIKELEFLNAILKREKIENTNVLRVTLDRERKLRKRVEKYDVLMKEYQSIIERYQNERRI